VRHGFGVRGAVEPQPLVRTRQVHGAAVALLEHGLTPSLADADAIVSTQPGVAVGVLTADCVPILAANQSGRVVAAIHAGWRGLAGGVIESGIAALRAQAGGEPLVAVIGPRIEVCCYEIDEPVVAALEARFAAVLAAALVPTRPGRHRLDLVLLARHELLASGLREEAVAHVRDACTCCDAARFHSWRRDGSAAGRILHHVAARRVDTPETSL
jgi:YfiH family protein